MSKTSNSSLLSGMRTYIRECEEYTISGQGGLSLLKDKRVTHLAESIKAHLDEMQREAQADSEISDLKSKITDLTNEIETYATKKT